MLQVKLKSWEKRLVDDQCGSDTKQLLKNAEQWEVKYLNALPKPGIAALSVSQQDLLCGIYIHR